MWNEENKHTVWISDNKPSQYCHRHNNQTEFNGMRNKVEATR